MPGGASILGIAIVAVWFGAAIGVAWYAKRQGSPYWPWHGLGGLFFGVWYLVIYYGVVSTRNRNAGVSA